MIADCPLVPSYAVRNAAIGCGGIAQSPNLRAQLDAHRTLKARLASHFAPIAERPVPEALGQAVRSQSSGNVVDFAHVQAERRTRALPRWTWLAAPALAASVALAVIAPGSRPTGDYAAGELAVALDDQLVETQRPDVPFRILLSFRDRGGRYCRAYDGRTAMGIACRDGEGWRQEKQLGGTAGAVAEYRQAGSASAALMASIQEMAAGPALDAAEEIAAQRHEWTSK